MSKSFSFPNVGTCTTPDDQIARIEELARKRK